MGISHLMSFIEHLEKGFPIFSIAKTYYEKTKQNTVLVIDSGGFYFSFFSHVNNDVFTMNEFIQKIAEINKIYHIELIFVFDGMNQLVKIDESLKRLTLQIKQNRKFFTEKGNVNDMPRGLFSGMKRTLRYLLMKHGIECVRAYSEADPIIVQVAKERKAYGIVSDDSDFVLSDVFHVFGHSHFLRFYEHVIFNKKEKDPMKIGMFGYDVRDIQKYIGIQKQFYPLFCLLCGNDFTKKIAGNLRKKLNITAQYNPSKNPNENINILTIKKVIGYLKKCKQPIPQIIEKMMNGQTDEIKNQIQMAVEQTNKMFFISTQPVNRNEIRQRIIP